MTIATTCTTQLLALLSLSLLPFFLQQPMITAHTRSNLHLPSIFQMWPSTCHPNSTFSLAFCIWRRYLYQNSGHHLYLGIIVDLMLLSRLVFGATTSFFLWFSLPFSLVWIEFGFVFSFHFLFPLAILVFGYCGLEIKFGNMVCGCRDCESGVVGCCNEGWAHWCWFNGVFRWFNQTLKNVFQSIFKNTVKHQKTNSFPWKCFWYI
jgi:hypothetical protein